MQHFGTKNVKAWKFVESGASSGIFKSNDGGESWQKISTKILAFQQMKT